MGYLAAGIKEVSDNLQRTIDTSAVSLASLQHQITSVAQLVMQNQRALDLLMADKGGPCVFLWEGCCYCINESGLVKTNIESLHKLSEELWQYNQGTSPFPSS